LGIKLLSITLNNDNFDWKTQQEKHTPVKESGGKESRVREGARDKGDCRVLGSASHFHVV